MKKFVSTMAAGFLGAALLLGVGYATGIIGGSTTTQTIVKGQPASYTTTSGIDAQKVYRAEHQRRGRDRLDLPRHHRHVGPVHR